MSEAYAEATLYTVQLADIEQLVAWKNLGSVEAKKELDKKKLTIANLTQLESSIISIAEDSLTDLKNSTSESLLYKSLIYTSLTAITYLAKINSGLSIESREKLLAIDNEAQKLDPRLLNIDQEALKMKTWLDYGIKK